MILLILFFLLLSLSWWAFSSKLQQAFYSEWSGQPQDSTGQLVWGTVKQQLRTFSPQNSVAQALVDFELKSKSLRSMLLMVCFQKLGVLILGLLIASSLQWEIFLSFLVVATVILIIAFKKPSRWIQIFLLAATFFGLYQWSFFRASQVIFSETYQDIAFFLADGRLFQVLFLGTVSIFLTFLIRFEFWSVLLGSILFFAGALPVTSAAALLVGETLGWTLFWWYWGARSSKVCGTLFREVFLLTFLTALFVMSFLLVLRGAGWLDMRIMGRLETKKILFLVVWAFWEISLTLILATWGHFRARSKFFDESTVIPIRLPGALLGLSLWGYKGWTQDQLQFRRRLMKKRVQSLESQLQSLNESEKLRLPPGFLDKTHQEVESLKRLLGSSGLDSV